MPSQGILYFFLSLFSILGFRVTSKKWPALWSGKQSNAQMCRGRSRKQIPETCLRGSKNLHRGSHAEGSEEERNNFMYIYINLTGI